MVIILMFQYLDNLLHALHSQFSYVASYVLCVFIILYVKYTAASNNKVGKSGYYMCVYTD